MCGIVGYIDYRTNSDGGILGKMTESLQHRGPDDCGTVIVRGHEWNLGMGHRRLSIIDLTEQGHQPMQFRELSIVFNGEIYNYTEIKQELEDRYGCKFDTHTDTEVILQAFYCWGVKCVERFIGMFAISLYDAREQKLFLVRDRAGVKPLFYYAGKKSFLFGSELKAFHKHPDFKKEIDKKALGFFLQYGYVGAPNSIFKDTKKVLPGHYIVYDLKEKICKEEKYWDVYDYYNLPKLKIDYEEAKEELKRTLCSAFEYRMVSDVPVGIFLSGGYDSSIVAAMLQKDRTEKLKTFTIGFKEDSYNEAGYAKEVARYLGTEHTEYYCTKQDAIDIIPELPYYYDEPLGDASAIPTILVSRIAKEKVKVALSADGGDESFAGYSRYHNMRQNLSRINRIPKVLHKPVGRMIETLNGRPLFQHENYTLASYTSLIKEGGGAYNKHFWKRISDDELNALIPGLAGGKLVTALNSSDLLNGNCDELSKMMAIDYKTYLTDYLLAKVDRATMSVSLEGREPMLDHRIIEFAARLPLDYKYKEGIKKRILKDIAWQYIPKELLERPKMGFFLPIDNWLKNALRNQVNAYTENHRIVSQGLFDAAQLKKLKDAFYTKNKNHLGIFLWFILMFQMWYEQWME